MNDCIETEVREALPDLIYGRLSDLDTATLTAHVESCADCRAEMDLLKQLRASAPLAPQMDVARIVSALPLPMPATVVTSAPSQTKPAPRRSFMWKTASVAALLVVGSLTFANSRRQSVVVPTVQTESHTVRSATHGVSAAPEQTSPVVAASAATQVAAAPVTATRAPAASVGLSLTGGVQDLTDDQLQALVNGLDNVKALPSAEPEAVSIGVDDSEGMQ